MKQSVVTLLCILFLSVSHTLTAGIDYVVLQLAGLACPFCNTHVIRIVEQTPGVVNPIADLALNRIRFEWDSSCPFEPWVFCRKVTRSGYSLESIWISATGSIEEVGDGYALCSCGAPALWLCDCDVEECVQKNCVCTEYSVSGELGWWGCHQLYLQVDDVTQCD